MPSTASPHLCGFAENSYLTSKASLSLVRSPPLQVSTQALKWLVKHRGWVRTQAFCRTLSRPGCPTYGLSHSSGVPDWKRWCLEPFEGEVCMHLSLRTKLHAFLLPLTCVQLPLEALASSCLPFCTTLHWVLFFQTRLEVTRPLEELPGCRAPAALGKNGPFCSVGWGGAMQRATCLGQGWGWSRPLSSAKGSSALEQEGSKAS